MKLTWKRNYGDNELTDDTVLWVDDQPSKYVISGGNGYQVLYSGHQWIYMGDTRKECKNYLYKMLGLAD